MSDIQDEILNQQETKIAYENEIESLKEEKNYSVGEDLDTLEESIKSNQLSIESCNEKITELKDKKSSLSKKITLLNGYIEDMKDKD